MKKMLNVMGYALSMGLGGGVTYLYLNKNKKSNKKSSYTQNVSSSKA